MFTTSKLTSVYHIITYICAWKIRNLIQGAGSQLDGSKSQDNLDYNDEPIPSSGSKEPGTFTNDSALMPPPCQPVEKQAVKTSNQVKVVFIILNCLSFTEMKTLGIQIRSVYFQNYRIFLGLRWRGEDLKLNI